MKNIKKTALALIMACSLIAAPALSSAADAKLAESSTETIEYKDGAKFTSNLYMKFAITSNKTAKVTGITSDYRTLFSYENPTTGKKGYNLYIPDTVTYNNKKYKVDEIGAKAFKGDKKLLYAYHGKNLKKIGNEAFANCTNLISVFDNKVSQLSKSALNAMKQEGNTVPYVNSSVEVIGDRAFQNCSRMSIINLGSKIRKIGSKAFDKVGPLSVTIMNENKNLKAAGVAKDFFSPSSKCKYVYTFSNVNKTCYYYVKDKNVAGKQKATHSSGVWKVASNKYKVIKSKSFKDFLTGKA